MPARLTASVPGRIGLEGGPQGGHSVTFLHTLAWEVTRSNWCRWVLAFPWDLPFSGRQEGDHYPTVR